MREKTQGARRLANAIWNRSGDPAFIKNLARLLNYEAKQLEEDAEALHDLCAHNPPKNYMEGAAQQRTKKEKEAKMVLKKCLPKEEQA